MLSTVNLTLDLIIKSSVVVGLIILTIFYIRVFFLDREIENLNKKFEENRNERQGQGRGIPQPVIDGQIREFEKERNEKIAPLERKRQRLLSKIPFLK